jgi:hypothetical protein
LNFDNINNYARFASKSIVTFVTYVKDLPRGEGDLLYSFTFSIQSLEPLFRKIIIIIIILKCTVSI